MTSVFIDLTRKTMMKLTRAFLVLAASVLATAGCKGDDNKTDAGADNGPGLTDATADQKKKADVKPDVPTKPKPKIAQVIPDNGFSTGNYVVTLVGENFAAGAAVYLDGQPQAVAVNVASAASLSFNMPANPYDASKAGKVSVGVMVNSQFSNQVDFRYTVSAPMTETFKGSVLTASTTCFRDFASDPILGRVLSAVASDAGVTPTVSAEVGFGKVGSDPSKDSAWKWQPATFSTKDGLYDVYTGAVTVPLSITYDVAYRFSADGGKTWVYADTDETDLKYDPAKAAKVTATDPPLLYCLSSTDCNPKYPYEVVCMVNTADKKKNVCVECLLDVDCTGYAKALGLKCGTKNQCGCAADGDCAKNPNGAKCLGWCGCESDNNCVAPAKCFEDKARGITVCR
jgi:hypothetical protein